MGFVVNYPPATNVTVNDDGTQVTVAAAGPRGPQGFAPSPKASGGNATLLVQDGVTYWVHRFDESGTFTALEDVDVEYLIVAGGGSGGAPGSGVNAAGGGAGGVLTNVGGTALAITAGSYSVTVGAGGARQASRLKGNSGANSTFGDLTSVGGGGGGTFTSAIDGRIGGDGGSGGGGTWTEVGGNGTAGQGNDGGDSLATGEGTGGGGGGAGTPGQDADGTKAGDGGDGVAVNIDGLHRYYGGGGGGASGFGGRRGMGGRGGGGHGAEGNLQNGDDGVDGLGGGGGGADGNSTAPTSFGGRGGSGVVIVRYLAN